MGIFLTLWVLSLLACPLLARKKNRRVALWGALGLFFGASAFLVLAFLSDKHQQSVAPGSISRSPFKSGSGQTKVSSLLAGAVVLLAVPLFCIGIYMSESTLPTQADAPHPQAVSGMPGYWVPVAQRAVNAIAEGKVPTGGKWYFLETQGGLVLRYDLEIGFSSPWKPVWFVTGDEHVYSVNGSAMGATRHLPAYRNVFTNTQEIIELAMAEPR
jgi:hypothetical protein